MVVEEEEEEGEGGRRSSRGSCSEEKEELICDLFFTPNGRKGHGSRSMRRRRSQGMLCLRVISSRVKS